MEQYLVTGMSCAACQARVEKAVSKVPGVESCAVNLLTNSMGVEGSADKKAIIEAVEKAGYGAALKDDIVSGNVGKTANAGTSAQAAQPARTKARAYAAEEEMLRDRETPILKKRLISSVVFLLLLMYISMGHAMWGWPLPGGLGHNPLALGLIEMVLAAIIMVINRQFFISGFKSLLHLAPNMDTLVAMGSGVSFGWSIFILTKIAGAASGGDEALAMSYMHDLYFESAAMILTLITVGKMLEARSKGKTTDALKSLMKLAPETATVEREGIETIIPISEVAKDDIFILKPGENVPVDGIVIEGTSAINEAALTGESIPVDKKPGDRVSAATTNQSGYLKCRATHVGEDTTLAKIIRMVSDAASTKAPIAKVADRVSGIFVPAVLGISVVVLILWLVAGGTPGYALSRAIAVLVISCPCALGLATPVAIMVGNGVGARNGILFKTAVSLEETGKVQVVALDKTGTITKGESQVTDIVPAPGINEKILVSVAYCLERKSEHPLSKAIIKEADEKYNMTSQPEIDEFEILPGQGLKGNLNGHSIYGGNSTFIKSIAPIPKEIEEQGETLEGHGKTCLYFAEDNTVLGFIAVADVIKADSPEAVKELQNMGIKVALLTGDNEGAAQKIGSEAGVDLVYSGVLPEGKEKIIRELQENGTKKVAMVGDGINDAPALTRADMGIAIGAGTDVAIDSADVVLMNSKLTDVVTAIKLSKETLRNIHQNLFWAFCYNIIGIPLAAGVLIKPFGLTLNPMFAAAAMSLSSFLVVSNALRLNLFKPFSINDENNIKREINLESKNYEKENRTMKKTMTIEGMMCMHCEATVKKALESLEGVESAEVSHEKGTAIVTSAEELDDELLKKTVEDKEYKVLGIQ